MGGHVQANGGLEQGLAGHRRAGRQRRIQGGRRQADRTRQRRARSHREDSQVHPGAAGVHGGERPDDADLESAASRCHPRIPRSP